MPSKMNEWENFEDDAKRSTWMRKGVLVPCDCNKCFFGVKQGRQMAFITKFQSLNLRKQEKAQAEKREKRISNVLKIDSCFQTATVDNIVDSVIEIKNH